MPSAAAALERLCDPGRQGQRPLPDRRGRQRRRAGAGGARAPGTPASATGRAGSALNDCSIGIELVNPGHEWGYRPFPEPQYAACIALCRAHPRALADPAGPRARAQRRRARAQAGPGRAVRLATAGGRRHRPVAGRRAPGAPRRRRQLQAELARLGYAVPRQAAGWMRRRAWWSRRSSATSGPQRVDGAARPGDARPPGWPARAAVSA